MEGRQPAELSIIGLARRIDVPLLWTAQEQVLGLGDSIRGANRFCRKIVSWGQLNGGLEAGAAFVGGCWIRRVLWSLDPPGIPRNPRPFRTILPGFVKSRDCGVEQKGFEPSTPTLRTLCSPN
jgi:hypothetical protein